MGATSIIEPRIPSAADLETKLRRQRHGKQQPSNDPDRILLVEPALSHPPSELRFLSSSTTTTPFAFASASASETITTAAVAAALKTLEPLAFLSTTLSILRFALHVTSLRIPAASGASRALRGGASLRALGG